MTQNSENKSKMDLLLSLASKEKTIEDNRSAAEIISDGLSDMADLYGWELDSVAAFESEDYGESTMFTFRRGASIIRVGYELTGGQFVTCEVVNQILTAYTMIEAFKQLGSAQ